MIGLGISALLLVIGAVFGIRAQKSHIANLEAREAALSHIIVTNLKVLPISEHPPQLVTGSVVIAFDYFRRFIATIVMLVGGRITMYEDMLDRARREALVRLLEQADAKGAREVHNIRFEFSRVGSSEGGTSIGGGAELLAYGTSIS